MRRIILIGRSSHADICFADGGVDAHHCELVITSTERLYLTDRGSEGGTFIRRDEDWKPVRQTFVEDEDELRIGTVRCTGADLRARASNAVNPADGGGEGGRRGPQQMRGAVERDPSTGEIVRQKF
ncbi:MAG: FHA domain-containing protein [Pseudomonadota bacterium]